MMHVTSVMGMLVMILPAIGQEPLITPRTVTASGERSAAEVAASITKQTGIEIDVTAIDVKLPIKHSFDKTPFWKAVEILAEQTASRVEISRQAKPVRLIPLGNDPRPPVAVEGPFRIEAKQIDIRIDLSTGKSVYDLTLQVAWEPQLPVYRTDSHPRVVKAVDDAGRAITSNTIKSWSQTDGMSITLTVRLDGLSRDSKRIASLEGALTITAAQEMLRFSFDDLTKPAQSQQKNVSVGFNRFAKKGNYWEVDLDLVYPQDSATFESFETYWLGRNRLTLTSPEGTKFTFDDPITKFSIKESKDFKPANNVKGWRLDYITPSTIKEVPVKFELKDIRLP